MTGAVTHAGYAACMTRAHTATACNPDDSSESTDDILETIPPLERQIQSLDQLCDALLPSVAAHIWRACCWPDRMKDGWKIGDHCFVVFSLTPERNTELYVQFWSEPQEPVLVEVCSGEWSPGSVKYVQARQRALLASLGYEIGGEAKNLRRLVRINSVADAEAAAREMLRIFYDALGYRGQWALDVRLERGERAEAGYMYTAVTPEDLAKLAAARGYTAAVGTDDDGEPIVVLRRGRTRFAGLFGAAHSEALHDIVILDVSLPSPKEMTAAALTRLAGELPGVVVRAGGSMTVRLSMLLRLGGGVTAEWIAQSLDHWAIAVAKCRRLLLATSRENRRPLARPRSRAAVNVH
jgi:hypothetical protein